MDQPWAFRFPEAIIFWAVWLWVFGPETRLVQRIDTQHATEADAGTAQMIVIGNLIAMVSGCGFAFLPWLRLPLPGVAFYSGLALMVIGSLLRRYCFRLLGKYFTGVVTVSPEQPVIETGPYHWIRHPSYTAGFLIFLGMGLALGHGLSIAILFLIPCYTYYQRVTVEERALLTTLGETYRVYRARTKRFIPFIY
jgi:protein-S-isoprenylcysteine O-methyltransferase Ste14